MIQQNSTQQFSERSIIYCTNSLAFKGPCLPKTSSFQPSTCRNIHGSYPATDCQGADILSNQINFYQISSKEFQIAIQGISLFRLDHFEIHSFPLGRDYHLDMIFQIKYQQIDFYPSQIFDHPMNSLPKYLKPENIFKKISLYVQPTLYFFSNGHCLNKEQDCQQNGSFLIPIQQPEPLLVANKLSQSLQPQNF